MSYPTMCCEVEQEITKAINVGDSNNIKQILDDTENILLETHDILLSISRNIMNMPNAENDTPKANCMNDQAIINRNVSNMCRSLAMEIKNMLFGGEHK